MERIGQGSIGQFAPGSELARERKANGGGYEQNAELRHAECGR